MANSKVTVDVNKTIDQAKELLQAFVNKGTGKDADLDQFTKAAVDHFASQGFNVMVIHNEQDLFSGDQSKVAVQDIEVSDWGGLSTFGYHIYVAPKGVTWTVTNVGDGGYTNWAFEGNFVRSGSSNEVVTFH